MANTQNLRPSEHKFTQEEARRGGINSGVARKKRKALREELSILLETGDTQQSIALALIDKAKTGDTRAFEVIRDTLGEKISEKYQISTDIDPDIINEIEKMVFEERLT